MKGKGKGDYCLSRNNNCFQEKHEKKFKCFKSLPELENWNTE